MTIDEAIAKYKEIANTDANCPAHCNISCDKCVQESKQIAEWLEELKELREKNETLKALYENVRKEGNNLLKRERNKAIDDFAEKLHHEEFGNEYGVHIVLTPQQVDELAEQLKEKNKV